LASNYTPDSCELALTSFRAPNGEGALVRSAYFKTVEEAKRYFDWRLKTAAKVTETGDNNDNGKRVGIAGISDERCGPPR